METGTQEMEPGTDTLKLIYAHFIFKDQPLAVAFAATIVERDWVVKVSYAPDRAHWQVGVRRLIKPVFRDITIWLTTLNARAEPLGGQRDGWGHGC